MSWYYLGLCNKVLHSSYSWMARLGLSFLAAKEKREIIFFCLTKVNKCSGIQ